MDSNFVVKNPISEHWFEYSVHVYPYHTDYAGTVWHGAYIAWMEAARIEYLHSLGLSYEDLVACGCTLPVVDLSIRYHRAIEMGENILIRTRLNPIKGVRLHWDYQIQSCDHKTLYVTARITLVPVDQEKGKIMRRLPPMLTTVLDSMTS